MKQPFLRLPQLDNLETMTRTQLKEIIGGVDDINQGSGGNCQTSGQMCYAALNCCSGLTCWFDHVCRI